MAIKKIAYLYCDGCWSEPETGEPYDYTATPNYPGWMQRQDAKKDGWTRRKGKDYCPKCSDTATDD